MMVSIPRCCLEIWPATVGEFGCVIRPRHVGLLMFIQTDRNHFGQENNTALRDSWVGAIWPNGVMMTCH